MKLVTLYTYIFNHSQPLPCRRKVSELVTIFGCGRDTVVSVNAGHTWQPVDYADGLVRVGVQSAIARPETGVYAVDPLGAA